MATNGIRDTRGRFIAGHPGNPKGRGRSTHAEAVAAVRRAAIDIGLPLLIEAAKGGDLEAVKELCRLGFPRMKPVTPLDAVPLDRMADLTAKAESVLEVVTSGQVSAETAETLLSALQTVSEVICIKCFKRWIAVRPEATKLRDLECENCGAGYVIESGERIIDD